MTAGDAAGAASPDGSGPELPESVTRWAQLPGTRALLATARRQLEDGRRGDRSRITVDLDAAGRRDVGRLLGLTWQTSGRPATLGMLRSALAGSGADLDMLLVATGGPLRDRRAEASQAREVRTQGNDTVRRHLSEAGVPEAVVNLAMGRRWLGPAGSQETATRATELATLIRFLPAGGALLATVAQDLFADPHALDRDRVLGRASARVLAATAALAAIPTADDGGYGEAEVAALATAADACSTAAGWRNTWATAGVTCDQLSSTVLALNLPLDGAGAAGLLLRAGRVTSEPVWLTARSLLGVGDLDRAVVSGWTVRVCENPSVMESAADQLGASCGPLVCTYGRPSTAAWLLLGALHRAGARLLVSADRDAAGDGIARDLLAQLPGSVQWLPEVPGLYEEERLAALLTDLRS